MRRTLVTSVAVALMLAVGPSAAAYAQPEAESFAGCPLLLEGQSSECIRVLQGYLNLDNDGYRLVEDGVFGEATRIAVLDYQGRNGLPADGNVGEQTADAILDRVEQVRREIEQNSVPSPRPGEPLDSGGAVALGKPAGQCLKEAFGIDEIAKETIEQDLKRQIDEAPSGSDGSRINKVKGISKIVGKASGALNALGVVKCMMWDMPDS